MEETFAESPSAIDEEDAKWMFRIALDGITYQRFHGDLDDDRYELLVEWWARSVAVGMWVSRDEQFPSEFLRELSGRHSSHEDAFLADVADRAARLYAEMERRGLSL